MVRRREAGADLGGAPVTPRPLPLAEASQRLRRPAGRPRRVLAGPTAGLADQRSPESSPKSPPIAGVDGRLCASLPLPRALPLRVTVTKAKVDDAGTQIQPAVRRYPASDYSGIPVRTLMRLIKSRQLRPIQVPGMGRFLLDRLDLDALLEQSKVPR